MSTLTPFSYEVPCSACPLRSSEVFRPIADEEIDFIATLKTGELRTGPGSTVLREGTQSEHLFTLLEGWAFRYKILSDGRRQVTSFVLPGDFIGLQSSTQGDMDHSVETLTSVALCTFPRSRIWELYKHCPSLAFDITWLAASQEILLDENLLSIGRRNAEECMAYYIVHLYVRAAGECRARHRWARAVSLHARASCRCYRIIARPHQQDAEAAVRPRPVQVGAWLVHGPGPASSGSACKVRPEPAAQASPDLIVPKKMQRGAHHATTREPVRHERANPDVVSGSASACRRDSRRSPGAFSARANRPPHI